MMSFNRTIVSARALALGVVAVAVSACVVSAEGALGGPRERLSLDRGWLFHLGDIPVPKPEDHHQTYLRAKAGNAAGAASPAYDDSAWRSLNIPHDWAVEGPFDSEENVAQGYRPRGVGWYRRSFRLEESDRGKHLELQFDGVATHCTVWINGVLAHRNWSGYTSFQIDMTPFAKYGDEANCVAVRVDANPMEGWWYEGAGIYRHAWLVKRNQVHVATDGVYANPVRGAAQVWTIPVEVTLESCADAQRAVDVEAVLLGPNGEVVTRATTPIAISPFETTVARISLAASSPRLWSVQDPALYKVRSALRENGCELDRAETTCGFRTIRFDARHGFFLNDEPLKIKGVCNHQDHAGLGVAVPDAMWDYRIGVLKEMGANAYRCSHHPPAAEFLDACDRLGMLVMDENRNFNTSPEYLQQLEWLVRRDRNHPSVFMWSVFNEEPLQASRQGYEMVRRMSHAVKRLDKTRPVTAAQSNSLLKPFNASMATDVVGINYQQQAYDDIHEARPDAPLISSEDTSTVMTRGEYATNGDRSTLSSYDTECQSWGDSHRSSWKAIDERPFVAGGFVWTGFDYHGEPQPLVWPATSSSFGCVDLCGFPKVGFYIRQAQWIDDEPILHLEPHWNWPNRVGEPVQVMAITNADTVTLELNGRPVGKKPVDKYQMVTFDVLYEPGRLLAVAEVDGQIVGRTAVETTGPAVALRLMPDRSWLAADGRDAMPVTVSVVDEQGRVVPKGGQKVEFKLVGPGEIIGLGNGDPTCHEPEKGNRRSLFNGLAQLIVQSAPNASGEFHLHAKANGLEPAEAIISLRTSPVPPPGP